MMKYISIETTINGKFLCPIGTGLIAKLTTGSTSQIKLYSGDSLGAGYADQGLGLQLGGTGFNQAFVDNINAAIVESLQSDYRAKPVAVAIPSGVSVQVFGVDAF
tara:strand:+ start:17935 stop:18249 length:315 start_codon:yes stop_codon:yes gene_type:complete